MVRSCSRFLEHSAVLSAHRDGQVEPVANKRLGPALVFERLWRDLGLGQLLKELLAGRKFGFDLERAIFLTVLHRLFAPGSDRAAEHWKHHYVIDGVDDLQLHHLYRAMAWLGEPLGDEDQTDAAPFASRCLKDRIEEALFAKNRDLFSSLELVFFDTTSIYFEGEGGQTIGQRGNSKDHRPDLKQMVVGMVLDSDGRPICCELWPGNTSDAKALIPIVDRLKGRFGIRSICIVADRGMISKHVIAELQTQVRNVRYILGARLRAVKEIREQVLGRGGRYHKVRGPRQHRKDPAPLEVKEVRVDDRRYIVCHNPEQAKTDRQTRDAIITSLREKLTQGGKQLVGNKGYRKYLKQRPGAAFALDEAKIQSEARFDGKWVLQTDTDMTPSEVALRYKDLLMVETLFRSLKSVLETRPIYHKRDETIRGHVFCSFLAAVLLRELLARFDQRGWPVEWQRLRDNLDALEESTITTAGKTFVIRSQTVGDAGKAIQAARIALGPVVRLEKPSP
ncbi:MAG: IS1634 family transposase [Planctomycetota bacterium]|nr:IS1634 family transposase [Planctomycetota bacterium]